jgi:O-antigen ligase
LVFSGLLTVALSCGAGFAASSLQPVSVASIAIAFLGVLAVVYVRGLVPRKQTAQAGTTRSAFAGVSLGSSAGLEEATSEDRSLNLRFARLLYYGGILLIGQLTFRPIFPLTLSDWLFFFALCATASALALRQPSVEVRLPSSLLTGIALFAIGGLLSSFDSELPRESIGVIVRLCYVTAVWFWLGTVVLRRVEHIRTAIVLWVCSAAVDGIGAILQYFKGDVIPGGDVNWGRMTGFTQNVNDLGGVTSAALVPALLILLFAAPTGRNGFLVVRAVIVALIATGLILSGSVGSVLAAGIAAALWFGSQPTRVRRLLALGAAGVACFVLLSSHNPTYSQSAFDRITQIGSGYPGDPSKTFDSRVEGYRIALARIEMNPFVGVGLDSESNRAGQQPVHNILLGTWFATGLLGLTGIIMIFVSVGRAALRAVREAPSESERALALALASSFTAFLVFLLSAPLLFTRYGWVPAALIFALRAVQVGRRRGLVGGQFGADPAPQPMRYLPNRGLM